MSLYNIMKPVNIARKVKVDKMGYVIAFLAGVSITLLIEGILFTVKKNNLADKIYEQGYIEGRADEAFGNGGLI